VGRQAAGPVRVVVVGGGVAALEFVLAARKLGEGSLRCTLVTPDVEFAYRPAAVAVPFSEARVFRFPISDVAAAAGARLRRGRVTQVDPRARRVVVDDGAVLEFDELVVATGARRVPVLEGAITFRGEEDVPAIERLLADIDARVVHRVAFALPAGATWPLPLYELALLTAAHVAKRDRRDVQLMVVSPEERPLAVFGGDVSATLRSLLEERGIDLHLGSHPASIHGDALILVPPERLAVDRVVCMPTARGIPIPGLPHDFEGFLSVDGYGRVGDLANVYALGDATNHPIKQGGIAAQQADNVAQLLAHQAGAPVEMPPRYSPSLKGLLLTGDEPHYLQARPAGGHGAPATISTDPLWWPGGKIAAPLLGSYLVTAAHR
jgi:sulfide:quinone oxidoreductase